MPSESRQIRVYIHSKDNSQKYISIGTIVNVFQHLQNVLYQVCDQVEENEWRKTGRYPKSVKESCDLVLKQVSVEASADVAVELSDSQTALPLEGYEKTFGEQAISITNDVFKIVRERDNIFPDLSPIISDERRRYRVLTEINEMWPEDNSKYFFEIGIGKKDLNEMSPKRKPEIERALEREILQSEKTVFGRLIELNVTRKHTCQIETEGVKFDCQYTPGLVDTIKKNIGEFVSISGKLQNIHTILLESEFAIKRINHIPIKQILIDEEEVELKEELNLTVNYNKEHDKYLIENQQFNIFAINNELRLAIMDIKEQMGILWKGYVKEDISNLSESAIIYRNSLLKIVGD